MLTQHNQKKSRFSPDGPPGGVAGHETMTAQTPCWSAINDLGSALQEVLLWQWCVELCHGSVWDLECGKVSLFHHVQLGNCESAPGRVLSAPTPCLPQGYLWTYGGVLVRKCTPKGWSLLTPVIFSLTDWPCPKCSLGLDSWPLHMVNPWLNQTWPFSNGLPRKRPT